MTRIAVTGASGFIGSRLCARLREDGYDVRPVARPFKTERVVAACDGVDAIVHLAALLRGSADQLHAANVEGTAIVAQAAHRLGVRLLHVSSLAVAGSAPPAQPRTEDDDPQPINAYGASKLDSERRVIAEGGSWTILRPAIVYGPGDRQFLPLFRLASRGLFLRPPRPDATYSLIHVDDVVEAIKAAAASDAAAHQVIFLAHREPANGEEILQLLARTYDRRYRPIAFPLPIAKAAAFAGSLVARASGHQTFDRARLREMLLPGFTCRTDRARAILGFDARIALEQGFAQTARWYRAQGWISGRP